jgi:uncharacterized protein (TIGR03382 family)
MTKVLGLTMLLMGAAGHALAGNPVPEIDGASAGAAVALLAGGLVVLRARRKK